MSDQKHYFFCGIGGSGMLPLAMILRAAGHTISGSDRALDQGRSGAKFDDLRAQGVTLFPQDGSGLSSPAQILVASAAVEDTVPDVAAALKLGCVRLTRAQMLAQLFNAAPRAIGVAGTSGKSTTTAMIATVLSDTGHSPTVMNGAVMKNFLTPDAPFASALVSSASPDIFVSEVDESDGSIAGFTPHIAVLNNISLDHKSMDELRTLFGGFVARAAQGVINLDDAELRLMFADTAGLATYGIDNHGARLIASQLQPGPTSISFCVAHGGESHSVSLKVPGRHNVSNALAAISAAMACGVAFDEACSAIENFTGIKRRFDVVGTANGITVIDDFGHNPDKIAATLTTLHDFPGRVLAMFQPHGFGPLKKMRREFAETFASHLAENDVLVMPEPVYFGGTVDRAVSSADLAEDIRALGRNAAAFATRDLCGARLLELAKPADRIVIMGARDDTLSVFAADLLASLSGQ